MDQTPVEITNMGTENFEISMNKEEIKEENLFKCSQCNFSSARKDLMNAHVKYWHDKITHMCDICGYTGINRIRLYQHKYLRHSTRTFKCSVCNYSALRQQYVTRHERRNHGIIKEKIQFKKKSPNNEILSCPECDFTTKLHQSLKRHRDSHSTNAKYFCQLCYFTTNTQAKLYKHKFVHSDKIYECHECDYKTKNTSYFRDHKRTRHRKFIICEKCQFVATSKLDFKKHLKICQLKENHQKDPNALLFTLKDNSVIDEHLSSEEFKNSPSLHMDQVSRTDPIVNNELHFSPLGRIFECAHCKFFTPWGISIKHHLLSHVADKLKFELKLFDYKNVKTELQNS